MMDLAQIELHALDEWVDNELLGPKVEECGARMRRATESGWHVCILAPGHSGPCSWARAALGGGE